MAGLPIGCRNKDNHENQIIYELGSLFGLNCLWNFQLLKILSNNFMRSHKNLPQSMPRNSASKLFSDENILITKMSENFLKKFITCWSNIFISQKQISMGILDQSFICTYIYNQI